MADEGKIKSTKSDRVAQELDTLARSLGSGERLPSVRTLCRDLGISLATLNSAMRVLEARGIIERRHGSGVYVTDQISVARVAVVVNATFYLAGGSPVWGMLLGELLRELRGGEFEAAIYFAQPGEDGGLATHLPTEFVLAMEHGRVDAVIAIGLDYELIARMEAKGLRPVSFAGPGSWVMRVNIGGMAEELAGIYAAEGKRTAMIAGCHNREHWEGIRKSLVSAGLEVVQDMEKLWSEQALVNRMAQPFLHVGQDFAAEFQEIVDRGEKPDVLFLMDDIFAHGFLMVWRNSSDRFAVELACHSNHELRMYMGWEGRLGLMEIEVLKLARILVEGVRIVLDDPDDAKRTWSKRLVAKVPDMVMVPIEEAGRKIMTLLWHATFLDGTKQAAKQLRS